MAMAFEVVAIGVSGWTIGRSLFDFADDRMDEHGHDWKQAQRTTVVVFVSAVQHHRTLEYCIKLRRNQEVLTSVGRLEGLMCRHCYVVIRQYIPFVQQWVACAVKSAGGFA